MLRTLMPLAALISQLAGCAALPAEIESHRLRQLRSEAIELNVTGRSAPSSRSEKPSKHQLTIWISMRCLPCRQFVEDLNGDREFRAAMTSHFDIEWVDFDSHRSAAATRNIVSVPTFDLGTRQVIGYDGKQELWQQLTTDAPYGPAAPLATNPTLNDDPRPAVPTIPPLSPPRPQQSDSSENSPESRVLADQPPASPKAHIKQSQASPPGERSPSTPASRGGRLIQWLPRFLPAVLTGIQLAGIIGGTAATGGLGTIAVAALWRLWKRRRLTKQAHAEIGRREAEARREGKEEDDAILPAPFPRQLDEAGELLTLRKSEGRVATLDALRGMFLDDELTKLASSFSNAELTVANKLKAAIDTRVDEVAPLSTTIG